MPCRSAAATRRNFKSEDSALTVQAKNTRSAGEAKPRRRAALASLARTSSASPQSPSRAFFFRALGLMLASGLGIKRALMVLSQPADDPVMADIARHLLTGVEKGTPLSRMMVLFPGAFSEVHVGMVEIGETTGTLDVVLDRLGLYEEQRHRNLLWLRSALTYPALVLGAVGLLLVFGLPWLLHASFEFIRTSGVRPPLYTTVVMSVASFLRIAALPALVGVALGAGPVAAWWRRSPSFRNTIFGLVDRVAPLRRFLREVAVLRFSRAFSFLAEAGVGPLHALPLAAQASGNPLLERRVCVAVEALRNGEALDNALERTGFFPQMMLQVTRVGLESGRLTSMLDRLADEAEASLEYALATLQAAAEPILLGGAGVVVAATVLAAVLPMVRILQAL